MERIIHDKKKYSKRRDSWDLNLGFYCDIRHYDKDGNLLYEELGSHNMITNEGLQKIWDVFFRGATAPTGFYMELYTNSSGLSKDSVLSDFTEPSGNGYAAVSISRDSTGWPTLQAVNGQMRITSKECTFQASGGSWPTVYGAYIRDASGTYAVCWDGFAVARTLQDQDTLKVTLYIERENPTAE